MERAVAGSPLGSTDRPRCLSGLSNLLRRRFEHTGAAEDLDRAVVHADEAVRGTPPQHVHRAAYLAHLANALHGRFEYAGATGDLDQAITFAREATRAGRGLPEADPDRGRYLTNLCGFLNDRYTRHGQVTDVEEAVVAGRAAVATVPAAHPERGTTLSNLSNAMISWFGETGDVDDLGRAVELATGAVAAVDAAHPERARFACHAVTGADDPSDGRLELHAESLMIRELAALTVPRGHLAYLSACGTAFGGTVLLDESVHIASGLQLAGFAHVIGTLWRVADADAAEITAMFYEGLAAGAGPAQAMHHVTRGMRRRYGSNPGMWAAYAHFGP
ncbi:CHAT domain-containing protein [Dactylosporangium sp. NBC_01737]|uniref:CHAT domain-containing protein n=1 Tax=Dactylosporangium sp. NBC_01737 TaxID=2975959 RepID=UPI002E14FD4B|nr:CHAT domain-containing protein [Dactylosporangium sp. NBC_01737]